MTVAPGDVGAAGDRLFAAGAALVHDVVATDVVGALRAAGVRAILLKGTATTQLLRAGGGAGGPLHLPSDVDLLVAPSHLALAERVLRARGMSPVEDDDPRLHSRCWTGGRPAAAVDLHRSISGVGASSPEAWSILTESTEWIETGVGRLEILSAAGRTLHLALHARNDRGGQPLADLQRALELLDVSLWREAASLSRRLGCVTALAFALRRSERGRAVADELDLPTVVPTDLALAVRDDPSLTLHRILATRGIRRKLRLVAARLLPPPRAMRARYPLARRGGAGLAAAYAQRALRIAKKLPVAALAVVAARRSARKAVGG